MENGNEDSKKWIRHAEQESLLMSEPRGISFREPLLLYTAALMPDIPRRQVRKQTAHNH